jgi:hypothetical protein
MSVTIPAAFATAFASGQSVARPAAGFFVAGPLRKSVVEPTLPGRGVGRKNAGPT